MATSAELAAYLATELTLVVGTTIFENMIPDTPDTCLAIYETAGIAADHGLGVTTGSQYENPGAQIVTRGAEFDSDSPRTVAVNAREALMKVGAQTLSGTEYLFITATQSPFIFKRDKNNRVLWAFNVQIKKASS